MNPIDIKEILIKIGQTIEKGFLRIPKIVKADLIATRSGFVKEAANTLDKAEDVLKKPLVDFQKHIEGFESFLKAQNPNGNFKHRDFRLQLLDFFNNLWQIPKNVVKVLGDSAALDSGQVVITEVVEGIPPFILYILSEGLKSFDGNEGPTWLTQSENIRDFAEKFKTKEEIYQLNSDELKILESDMKKLKLAIKIFNPTLELIKSLCPEDLSINLDILGEGGGSEVAGHPIKIPFNVLAWISAMADVACDEVLEMISDK